MGLAKADWVALVRLEMALADVSRAVARKGRLMVPIWGGWVDPCPYVDLTGCYAAARTR